MDDPVWQEAARRIYWLNKQNVALREALESKTLENERLVQTVAELLAEKEQRKDEEEVSSKENFENFGQRTRGKWGRKANSLN